MPIEQRVVSAPRPTAPGPQKIQPRERNVAPVPEEPAEKKKKPIVLILIIVVAVLAVAGAAYWFFLRPSDDGAAKAEPEKVAGEVTLIDSMNINLADGHYLRVGFGVQLTDKAEEVAEARVRDTAIELFSGQKMADVLDPTIREGLKAQLADRLDKIYDGEVMDVYLTDFVAQ